MMWRSVLSACVLTCLVTLSSTLLVPNDQLSAFNDAIRKPMLKQVAQELQATKQAVQGIVDDINKCQTEISKKYAGCATCLNDKYTERNPTKSLSVSNALMSLCSYTNVKYELCQLFLDREQPFLEFIDRATKRVQRPMFSKLKPHDAVPMLEVFKNLMRDPWASSAAVGIRQSVDEALSSIQTPMTTTTPQGRRRKRSDRTDDTEHLRSKRWTKYMKSAMKRISGDRKHRDPKYMAYMQKYMKMGTSFMKQGAKMLSKKKAPKGHTRTKRWLQMVQNIMANLNVTNTTGIMGMMGTIQRQIPFTMPARLVGGTTSTTNNADSATLKCNNRGRCDDFVRACAASSCPDHTKHMIIDVCGQSFLPGPAAITDRLERTKDVFDDVRTEGNFIKAITYVRNNWKSYQEVTLTASLQPPNVIRFPEMRNNNMQIAANNGASAIMKGLMPVKQTLV